MVFDFTPQFAIATPGADLLDKVVGIGTCSGADTVKFGLTSFQASLSGRR